MLKAIRLVLSLVLLSNFILAGLAAIGLAKYRKEVRIANIEGILLTCMCIEQLCELAGFSQLGPDGCIVPTFRSWWLMGASVLAVGLWSKVLYTFGVGTRTGIRKR